MSLLSWMGRTESSRGRQVQNRKLSAQVRRRRGRQLLLEGLEDRRVLAHVASLEIDPTQYDPSSILVRFRNEAAEGRGASIVRGSEMGDQIAAVPGLRSVHLPQGHSVDAALAAYRGNPDVLYAEPNYRVQAALTPNDPQFSSLYGLNNAGQTGGTPDADIDAPGAWDITTGSQDIVVAVIDTGVDYTHEDLAANMWVNSAEIPGNGQDDDANGFVDDVHGYDFFNRDGDPYDDNFHGTHVAGTIGAVGNNGIGVAGVNWGVKIMALKFLDSGGGGWTEDAIAAVNYATMMRASGVDIRLTSNSWGGGAYSQALADAIEAGGDAGILFVAAAGNDGVDADFSPMYPAAYDSPYIVSVAATDHFDQYAYFTNWGATSVDLAAPGVDILSTMPGNQYGYLSGTSMATPHVSGAAALVWSAYPDATPLEVKQRLMAGAEYIGDLGGNAFRPTLTNGRLNVLNAMEDDSTPPDPITGLTAVESTINTVTLAWIATGDDGSEGTATSYDVRYSTSPITDSNWDSATRALGAPLPQASGSPESFTVAGLSPDENYYFGVRALDNTGNASPLSDVVQASTQPVIVVFEDDMESGAPGWAAWGLWHLAPWRSTSPTTSFYYGDDATLTYETGWANSGAITSPLIDLSGAESALLSFNEFRQVENLAPYDRAAVNVSQDGSTWQTVWESYSSTAGFENRMVDLSPWADSSIYIQFQFDTGDELYNFFEGWYVDDVQVWVPGSKDPGIYIDNVSLAEGDQGTVEATFTVSLFETAGAVSVNWTTADGSAGGADYESDSGLLSFAAGETSKTITVSIQGDENDEANEDFFVNLSGAFGAEIIDGQGRATIVDDDTAGFTMTPVTDLVTSESGATRKLNVALTSEPASDVTVNLASSDTTEGTVSPASLVFTKLNWNQPQEVTLTGVNDALDDGDVFYFVSATTSSSDGAYSGLSNSVQARNLDNDNSITITNSTAKAIPDGGSTTSTLLVPGSHTILDINAQVSITHAKDDDLDVFLRSPGGTQVELFTDVGGSGNNFINTKLDDEASTSITAGSAPFNGTYRPEGSLSAFDGTSSNGTWTLMLTDDKKGQKGSLTQWSITILYEDLGAGSAGALVRPASGQSSSASRSASALAPLSAALVDPVFAESAAAMGDSAGSLSKKSDPQHSSTASGGTAAAGSAPTSGLATLQAGLGTGSAGGQTSSAAVFDAALDSLLAGGGRRRRR